MHLSVILIYSVSVADSKKIVFPFITWFLFIEGKKSETLPPLKDIRERCIKQLEQMRCDHMRRLNPTPYKVCSFKLFCNFIILNNFFIYFYFKLCPG